MAHFDKWTLTNIRGRQLTAHHMESDDWQNLCFQVVLTVFKISQRPATGTQR